MIRVGIIGATGYAGVELLRVLLRHPQAKVTCLTSESYKEKKIWEVFPGLKGHIDLECISLDVNQVSALSDLVFLALPHKASMDTVAQFVKAGKKVIDLSADFRLREVRVYEEWYQTKHTQVELLKKAIYGLPELYRDKLGKAFLVANPGCYPVSAILGVAPLLVQGLAKPDNIIIDSKSGASGAGRKLALEFHYSECNENVWAYGLATHRHTPEIEQELSRLAKKRIRISFTPHVVPMTRGILTTSYVNLKKRLGTEEVLEVYKSYYKNEPFIRVLEPEVFPQTKAVYGSNYCDIGLKVDSRTNRAIAVSAIDNLVRGASGQAVQNMNIMCGYEEREGLDYPGIMP